MSTQQHQSTPTQRLLTQVEKRLTEIEEQADETEEGYIDLPSDDEWNRLNRISNYLMRRFFRSQRGIRTLKALECS
jgi:hypothetical protein